MHGDDSPLKFSIDSGFTTRYRCGRRRCVPVLGTWFPPESGSMAIRYCSFATRGYHLRQWMQMMSLRLADSSVELSCWNLNRLEREGIREAIPWFDPNLQGAGFWVWKPFIILKELEHLEEGDYLLYTDAGRPPGRLFHHSLEPFVQWLREKGQDMMPGVNISYYTGGLTRWCKQSVFDELKLDSGSFEQAPLIQGSFLFLKNRNKASEFSVNGWICAVSSNWCLLPLRKKRAVAAIIL